MKVKLYFLTLVLSTIVYGQGAEINVDYLPGIWQMDVESTLAAIPQDMRYLYDGKTEERQGTIRVQLSRQQFHFGSDGTFVSLLLDGDQYPGDWTLNGKEVTMRLGAESLFTCIINELTNDKLVLTMKDPLESDFIRTMHFALITR